MTIVAHPDDEDGGMLAYESRGLGVRTAIMTLTRGEGGQNAMSSATFDALALIRTNELLNADAYYGGSGITQYFGRVADYGFSKTMDEALEQWGHDRVLYDAVRVVRMNRPLVVTSTFVGGITDGHGHHQVAGLLAQEVFKYAGDPSYFPDQIAQGLRPWKPLKVYARTPFFSVTSKGMFDYATGKWSPVLFHDYVDGTDIHGALSTEVKVPEGTFDPVLGESYAQIARIGLGEQRTQHEGPVALLGGETSVGYHRFGSDVAAQKKEETGFFDGIDTSLPGMAMLAHSDAPFLKTALANIQAKVADASLNYIPAHPEKTAPALHDGYLLTAQLIDQVASSSLSEDDKYNLTHELHLKLAQFNDALAEALGLKVSAYVLPPDRSPLDPKSPGSSLSLTPEFAPRVAIPGSEVSVRVHVASAGGTKLVKTSLRTPEGANTSGQKTWPLTRLGAPGLDDPNSTSGDVVFRVSIPRDAQPTEPYFSRPSIEQAYYNLDDPRWLNHPFAPYPLAGAADFDYDGVTIHLESTALTSQMIDGLGGVSEPFLVAPALSVALNGHAGIVPIGADAKKDFPLSVSVHSNESGNTSGTLHLTLPGGWTSEPSSVDFQLALGETRSFDYLIHPASLTTQAYMLKAVADSGNSEYTSGYQQAGYPGIRPYNLYRSASYSVTGVDVKVAPSLRVGYVMGTGDETPAALTELGIAPRILTANDILNGDLSSYDSILIGIRAYASRPELATAKARLLAYVHGGGNLVVQYQGPEFDHNFAPYPCTLGGAGERVVDEKDTVTITDSNSPLLNFPNHITGADFDHWVEERGHGFMESWSPQFSALTETHDAGQDPQRGGLLYARYGSGTYIYAAYALYRQTPEAVPGAFRLLANLVSAGKAPAKPGQK